MKFRGGKQFEARINDLKLEQTIYIYIYKIVWEYIYRLIKNIIIIWIIENNDRYLVLCMIIQLADIPDSRASGLVFRQTG